MNRLRTLQRAKVFMLACYLCVLGVAVFTPWLAGRAYASVCSSAGTGSGTPSLDCPACLPLQAPPQAACGDPALPSPAGAAIAAPTPCFPATRPAGLPPARGPPSV
jgi:hypothetical protein